MTLARAKQLSAYNGLEDDSHNVGFTCAGAADGCIAAEIGKF